MTGNFNYEYQAPDADAVTVDVDSNDSVALPVLVVSENGKAETGTKTDNGVIASQGVIMGCCQLGGAAE